MTITRECEGGIFSHGSRELQTAFKLAIQTHNSNNNSKFRADPVIDVVNLDDPFQVTNAREYSMFFLDVCVCLWI